MFAFFNSHLAFGIEAQRVQGKFQHNFSRVGREWLTEDSIRAV